MVSVPINFWRWFALPKKGRYEDDIVTRLDVARIADYRGRQNSSYPSDDDFTSIRVVYRWWQLLDQSLVVEEMMGAEDDNLNRSWVCNGGRQKP